MSLRYKFLFRLSRGDYIQAMFTGVFIQTAWAFWKRKSNPILNFRVKRVKCRWNCKWLQTKGKFEWFIPCIYRFMTILLYFCRLYWFDVHCILKENIRFHLYINTAPCGDARIFSPHETNVPGNREADTNGASTTKNVTTNNPSDVSKRYILWQLMLLIYI